MKTLTQIEIEFDTRFKDRTNQGCNLFVNTSNYKDVQQFYRQAFTEVLEGLKLEKIEEYSENLNFTDMPVLNGSVRGYNQASDKLESLKQLILK
jgi:predicted ATP-binding protein involved in virulence